MAYTNRVDKVTLKLGIVKGIDEEGAEVLRSRSFRYINPNVTDDVLGEGATKLGAFFSQELRSIKKVVEHELIQG
ncbi:MAG: DUF1659 domain-containing protein [Peptoniphilus sp.]|nr:DUF1659 domain-containing protein [Peptoniphilus sp.]